MIEENIPDWVKHDVDEALAEFDFTSMEGGFYYIHVVKEHETGPNEPAEIEEWCACLPASKIDVWYGRPADDDQDETEPLTWRDCQDIKEIVYIR